MIMKSCTRRAFVAGMLAIAAIVGGLAVTAAVPSSASGPAGDWSVTPGWGLQTEDAAARIERQAGSPNPIAHASVEAPAGAWFARGFVTGTRGRAVVVRIGGVDSPPLYLDASRQVFGINGTSSTAGPLQVLVDHFGTWAAGDSVTVQDVVVQQTGPTTTFVGEGRQIMIQPSGGSPQPLVAKGYTYTSLEIGGQPLYWPALQDPGNCQRDARLLGASGVNVLRVIIGSIERVDVPALLSCMSAFHANGIGIVWLEQGLTEASTVVDHDVWIDLWKQKLTPAIDTVSGHPATIMWAIGNEVEIQSPGAKNAWYGSKTNQVVGRFDAIAQHVRQRDPNHLVGTTVAGSNHALLADANLPNLQYWAFNMYPRPEDTLNSIAGAMTAADPRPKLITEIGTDRLRCLRAVDSEVHQGLTNALSALSTAVGGNPVQPAWRTYTCAAGSGDDVAAQTVQGSWNGGVWDNVANHLATSANPNGAWSGALYFMSTDWWWFNILTNGFGTMHTHETQGFVFQMSDSNFNPEFAGSMYAQLPEATDMRMTSIGLDAMGAKWASTPPPAVSDASVTVSGCTATVRWTSSEPSASEVHRAVDGADPTLAVDNTIFQVAAYDATMVTQHAVAVTLTPGFPHRLAGRSFTADGRHATTGPLFVAACLGL